MATCYPREANYELGRMGWPPQMLTKLQLHRQRKKVRILFAGLRSIESTHAVACFADSADTDELNSADVASGFADNGEPDRAGAFFADVADNSELNSANVFRADLADNGELNSANVLCADVADNGADLNENAGACFADHADNDELDSANWPGHWRH